MTEAVQIKLYGGEEEVWDWEWGWGEVGLLDTTEKSDRKSIMENPQTHLLKAERKAFKIVFCVYFVNFHEKKSVIFLWLGSFSFKFNFHWWQRSTGADSRCWLCHRSEDSPNELSKPTSYCRLLHISMLIAMPFDRGYETHNHIQHNSMVHGWWDVFLTSWDTGQGTGQHRAAQGSTADPGLVGLSAGTTTSKKEWDTPCTSADTDNSSLAPEQTLITQALHLSRHW